MSTTSCEAYIKASLHAMKYPTQAVMGLLLGKRLQDGSIFVSDAVPVLHTGVAPALSPTVETAMTQVRAVGKARGLVLVGVYAANETLTDNEVRPHTRAVGDLVRDRTGASSCLIWQMDNRQAQLGAERPAFAVHSSGGPQHGPIAFGRWCADVCGVESVPIATAQCKLAAAAEAFMQTSLVDFEEHLEHLSRDYFNTGLLADLLGPLATRE